MTSEKRDNRMVATSLGHHEKMRTPHIDRTAISP